MKKQLRLLRVKDVIKLVLHHAAVHANNVGRFMVEISVEATKKNTTIESRIIVFSFLAQCFVFPEPLRCLLLHFQALDALHVAHSCVDGRVVHGLDGGFDSAHGALLLFRHLSLSGHAVAFSA